MARKSGLLSIIKPLFSGKQESYEEAFHQALKQAIEPGNVVWDIGANVGLYTNHFLAWVGPSGKVVAFEPLPKAFDALRTSVQSQTNKDKVMLECIALSNRPGKAVFAGDTEDESVTTTAHLADSSETGGAGIPVEVSTADLAITKRGVPAPNVVKIDVEGSEEDVLLGGQRAFSQPACRHLLIEMHFNRMDERKLGDSASRIVAMLKDWKYKIDWVDASHLHGSR